MLRVTGGRQSLLTTKTLQDLYKEDNQAVAQVVQSTLKMVQIIEQEQKIYI